MSKITSQQRPAKENIGIKEKSKISNSPEKIFLIGFMGSGKTYWGKVWAENEGLVFYDLDAKIEKAYRMSITDIFEKKGEEKFRELERYHLRKFEIKQNFILACGGGTPCFSGNIEWMKLQGKVFYLKAEPELIFKHIINERIQRPVIKNVKPAELLFFIKEKLQEREQYYTRANFILNVEKLHKDSLAGALKK